VLLVLHDTRTVRGRQHTLAIVRSVRPDGGYGEVDAEVVRDNRTPDAREVQLALSGETYCVVLAMQYVFRPAAVPGSSTALCRCF
jgi:hypothetical protein